MRVHGDYQKAGYARVERMIPLQVAEALLKQLWRDLLDDALPVRFRQNRLLTKPAVELHSSKCLPITTFLWGLTPAMSELTKCELLPTYAFFRLYQHGDKLRVHNDNHACEHSLSLTLGYSEGEVWSFEVGQNEAPPKEGHADAFGDEPYSTVAMLPGDAVAYRGIRRRHGRLTANPNQWSAHLFLHWVDPNGPYLKHAFAGWSDPPSNH